MKIVFTNTPSGTYSFIENNDDELLKNVLELLIAEKFITGFEEIMEIMEIGSLTKVMM